MKVPALKEFVPTSVTANVTEVIRYLSTEMIQNLRGISLAFKKLTFLDNFESFVYTGIIPANMEVAIRNELRNGIIPTQRIILRGDTYSMAVVDGDTEWNQEWVYLKNTDPANNSQITVLFLK